MSIRSCALDSAMNEFTSAFGAARSGRRDLKGLNASLRAELSTIAGKLLGYRTVIAYSVPRERRRDLREIIRSNVPAENGRRQTVDAAPVPAQEFSGLSPTAGHQIMSVAA